KRLGIGRALEREAVERRGDRRRQDGRGEAELEAVAPRDSLECLGERVPDRVASFRKLVLELGIADAERPELVEQERPLRIPLEESSELLGRVPTRFVTLGGIAHRAYLGDPLLDLAIGEGQEKLLLAGEVRVERADREAGLRGDLVDRRAVVAAAGEHLP